MKKEIKNQSKAIIIIMILLYSIVFVFIPMPVVSALDLSSSVNSISPYWQNAVPEVNIRATVNVGTADNVTLYYRWSTNNASWNSWQKWIGVNNPDPGSDTKVKLYAWTFSCPNGTGYYEFYSIAAYNGNYEGSPSVADARCHINYSSWTRFGYVHVGYYPDALYYPDKLSSVVLGSNFTCPSNGIADNMTVFLANYDSSTHVICAIYNRNGGNLVGYTEEKNIGYVLDWITFDFIGEPTLIANTEYYLVVWGDGGYLRYDANNSHNIVGRYLVYTGVFPDNIGGLTTKASWVLSLYCRYTESASNNPPYTPSNPNPANHATSVGINADLGWTGGDQDSGDTVTYDVYFGTSSNPPKVSTGQSGTSYEPGPLSYNTKYYWKIVAMDNHGATSTGSIWDFTTGAESNNPPNTPTKPSGPISGRINKYYFYKTSTIDPNGDKVYILWNWGDGTNSGWQGPYNSGEVVTRAHKWTKPGIYLVKVKSKDIHGAESGWSLSLSVTITKS